MSGKIPQHFIDELLQRVDIVDVIDQRAPLKKAGKDYQARCPFHDERTPSFTVSQVKQFYHCFGCGANGNVISFLMNYDHMEFPEAIEDLANRVGMQIPVEQTIHSPVQEQRNTLIPVLERASRLFQSRLRKHRDAHHAVEYLKRRGLSGEIARRFELGFAPDEWDSLIRSFSPDNAELETLENAGLVIKREQSGYYDRFRGRIMFPIRDHRGRTVAFGGRILGEGEPKYLNSPETPVFHKGSELYGLFAAREPIRNLGHCIIVEGYMDVVALAQHEIDNAVATLGTATTPQHLHRIFRITSHAVFCFDGDRAGRDAARKAMETALPEMHGGRQISFLFLPEGLDPDDFVRARGTEAFRSAVETAMPLDEFLFKHLGDQTTLNRRDGRARMVELARPLLGTVPPGPYKELLTKRLAQISGLDDNRYIENLIGKDRPKPDEMTRSASTSSQKKPSAFIYLISLLLQQPQLIRSLPPIEGLAAMTHPVATLLSELIQILKDDDLLTTAALVERFRDTRHHARLEKLAAWNHQIVEGRLDVTAQQYVNSVRRLTVGAAIEQLQTKDFTSLTDEEKRNLVKLQNSFQRLRPDTVDFD